jgi:ZIP family zinc transporter
MVFTWGMTPLGASLVFTAKNLNKRILDGTLGFAVTLILDVALA